jgi:hypothetical protein
MRKYQDKDDLILAVKQVCSDIMIMTHVNLDFMRTKQLANVLYQLSDLVYFESVFDD